MDTDIQNEILEKMRRTGSLYFQLMQTVFESGKENREENWEKMYRCLSENYLGAYHEFAGKYLKVPPLGVYREALQQLMDAMDVHHQFAAEISDFFVKLGRPLGKSLKALDQALKSKDASKNDFQSPREIYAFLSDLLEKEYDDYLKSSEGVQDVVDVIHGYIAYRKKSDDAKDIWLKSLSIPTTKEMEDVYRSIYELKKRVRKQDQQIAEQQLRMDRLSDRIRVLEAEAEGKSGKKKPTSATGANKPPVKESGG